MKKIASYFAGFCVFAAVGPWAAAQTLATPQATQEANLKAYINMMRQDLKVAKVSILTEMMEFSPEDAAKFWPVYDEYDKSLTKLSDERVAFIRLYADNYSTLTDETATKIAMGLMDVEARRANLRKEYFQRFSKTLTAKDAARWLQIEAQIERLVDLQLLSSLPIVE